METKLDHFRFYVYAYLRKDGTPYYIGKGTGHRAYDRTRHTVRRPRDRELIVFIEKNLSEIGAYALERRMIRWFGRRVDGTGILRNRAEGGEGAAGMKGSLNHMYGKTHTEEARQKMRRVLAERYNSKPRSNDQEFCTPERYAKAWATRRENGKTHFKMTPEQIARRIESRRRNALQKKEGAYLPTVPGP